MGGYGHKVQPTGSRPARFHTCEDSAATSRCLFRKLRGMQKHLLTYSLLLSVLAPPVFGQETTLWEYNAGLTRIGHFEVTPLGSIFVGRPDRALTLDQYTGQVLWERTDIQGCNPRADDPDTTSNEADGTIRCQVLGMASRGGFGSDADFRTAARFSSIPNTNLGIFETGFRGRDRTSERYMAIDLDTGDTLWDSAELSLERTRGYLYVAELNRFLLAGEDANENGLIVSIDGSDGTVLWQQETDIVDRFKFLGVPNGRQILAYGKQDDGSRTLVSIGLSAGGEQWRVEGLLRNDANNRNVLLRTLDDESAVLYITKDGPFLVKLDSGELIWQVTRWNEDPPDPGTAGMVLGEELLFVPSGRHARALRLEDGVAVWQTRDRFDDDPVDMRMLTGGLLVRAREIDLLDPETGRSRWQERSDRFDENSQVLVEDDALYVAEDERLSVIDLSTGEVARLAEYDLDGDDPPRMERLDESLVLMSRQNILKISRSGDTEYHVFQNAPSAGFFSKLLAAIDAAVYSLEEDNTQRFTATGDERVEAQQRYDRARTRMLDSFPVLRERARSGEDTTGGYYLFTDTPVAGREGYSLVQIDKTSGTEVGRLWTEQRTAKYTPDDFLGTVYFQDTPDVLRALRLGSNPN